MRRAPSVEETLALLHESQSLRYENCGMVGRSTAYSYNFITSFEGFSAQIQGDRRLTFLFFVNQSVVALNRWGNLQPCRPIPSV